MTELRRPRSGRIIGGVCAALARRFGWDVALVRVVTVIAVFFGAPLLAYLVAWLVIPGEDAVIPPASTPAG